MRTGHSSVRIDAVVEALHLLGAQRAAHMDEASKAGALAKAMDAGGDHGICMIYHMCIDICIYIQICMYVCNVM